VSGEQQNAMADMQYTRLVREFEKHLISREWILCSLSSWLKEGKTPIFLLAGCRSG
jgi:hypothetical protein